MTTSLVWQVRQMLHSCQFLKINLNKKRVLSIILECFCRTIHVLN